ncbi:hypothetical protein TNIN_467671, partial [Trichonephila inaurata madagascariensis]
MGMFVCGKQGEKSILGKRAPFPKTHLAGKNGPNRP